MTKSAPRPFWASLALAVLALPAVAAPPKLTAAQILDRYVAATGSPAAYARIHSTVTHGTMAVKAQGLSGEMTVYHKAPNKMLEVQTISALGESKQCFDGKSGWANDPLMGLRELAGTELELVRRAAEFNSTPKWRMQYPKQQVLGIRNVDGRDAYLVKLFPIAGKPILQYHDAKTFLMVKSEMTIDSPQGSVPVVAYLSDYRAVDGVKSPFKLRQKLAGSIEMIVTIKSIENNVEIDDKLFVKPAGPPKAK